MHVCVCIISVLPVCNVGMHVPVTVKVCKGEFSVIGDASKIGLSCGALSAGRTVTLKTLSINRYLSSIAVTFTLATPVLPSLGV